MTNSIATAKCPSALTSGNYGMSQNRYTDESKDYFFVKLTDSAYRAIEEYQRNENSKRFTNGQCPKIQVNGNSGVIYFPTLDSNEGRKFGFTIDDVEGSLECIQQTAEGLDVLGSIPYRMRIHANDDIYDTTRTKMAIAEETEKSKCIREIKPNQTDIGRKVKKSVPSSTVYSHLGHSGTSNGNNNNNSSSNYLSSLSRNKLATSLNNNSPPATQHTLSSGGSASGERMQNKLGGTTSLSSSSSSSRSPNPTLLGGSGTIASGGGGNNSGIGNNRYGSNIYSQSNVSPSLPSLTSASSLSSTLAGGIANGYASAAQHNPSSESATSTLANSNANSKQSRLSGNTAGGNGNFSRGGSFSGNGTKAAGNGGKAGGASNAGGGGKLPDISRRKIRERLIHLLALRPFKKPELYARLQNEGLRDRERSLISNILKDIALSRDNTYNLRRQMWNDVNENWPYYTEQELQQLKRRKPQNLTPPLSSDAGSSTSGQSPTSTHTGSPPPLAGGSGLNGGNSLKRTSLEYDEPFPPKKQRISHMAASSAAVNRINPGIATNNGVGGSAGSRVGTNYATKGGSGGNTNFPMQRNKHTTGTYSPQGSRTAQSNENSGSNDLSYNVLNMDDFMLNIDHQQQGSSYVPHSSGSSGTRKSNNGNNGKSATGNPKENRYSGSNNSSSNATTNTLSKNINTGSSVQENESSSSNMKHALKRGALAGSPKGSLPYGVNFVPESNSSNATSGSSRSTVRDSSGSRNSSGNYRQSPSYMQQQQQLQHQQQQQQKSNNSVIYSPKMHPAPTNSGNIEHEEHVPTGRRGGGNNKSQTASRSMAPSATGKQQQQLRGVDVRTPTPPVQDQHQQQQQQQQQQHNQRHLQQGGHYQTQQTHSANIHSPVQRLNTNNNNQSNYPVHQHQQHQPQQQQHQIHYQQQQQQPQRQSASQLPAATANHSAITDEVEAEDIERPSYDFSDYTAITTIEQRRQYKTEFERDYDEYRQLLERIEDVRRNFQALADQLQRVPQGCMDYEHIKEQIVAEYERINNEEECKRDKERFDYLHAKLAHIKQLVTDYDKALTSMAAAAAAAAAQQQQQQQLQHQKQQQEQQLQQQQQEYASTTAAMHLAADATSHYVDSSNNVLMAAATAHTARVSPMVSGSESNHSPPSGYQNQTQYYVQQQQQQQHQQNLLLEQQQKQQEEQHQNNAVKERKKKHTHAATTLQQQHNQQQQQYYMSPHNQAHASSPYDEQQHNMQQLYHQQQQQDQFNGHQQQHHYQGNNSNNNNNNNNNDSDSDDSSDSNDEDSNDDDDSNEDDDDDGSDRNSNNDGDDDDEHF